MRATLAVTLIVLATAAMPATAQQQSPSPENGFHVTIFRSPATGIEWRAEHVGIHVGFYPTIIARNHERANTNFIRAGGTWYLRSSGFTPYISPSLVLSLDEDWDSGALTELGLRMRVYRTLNARLGAGVLTTFDGEVRVNPTVGLDMRVGGGR